jgi:hypothetical protein
MGRLLAIAVQNEEAGVSTDDISNVAELGLIVLKPPMRLRLKVGRNCTSGKWCNEAAIYRASVSWLFFLVDTTIRNLC